MNFDKTISKIMNGLEKKGKDSIKAEIRDKVFLRASSPDGAVVRIIAVDKEQESAIIDKPYDFLSECRFVQVEVFSDQLRINFGKNLAKAAQEDPAFSNLHTRRPNESEEYFLDGCVYDVFEFLLDDKEPILKSA